MSIVIYVLEHIRNSATKSQTMGTNFPESTIANTIAEKNGFIINCCNLLWLLILSCLISF